MKGIRQAVILAGGEGTRLRPLTLTIPKPLIPVHGKPFAEYLIEVLKKNGVEEIIFLTGYLAEQFPQTLGDGSRFGLSIQYARSDVSDDTGERLRKASSFLDEEFLLLYGDNYWPLDIVQLLAHHRAMGTPATVTVYEQSDPAKKNNTKVDGGLVRVYDNARETSGCNGVDIGFFILSKTIVDQIPEGNVHFEKTMFPRLIQEQQLAGFLTQQPYWSLTDMSRMPTLERALDPARKVLFLDRDGTINAKAPQGEYVPNWSAFTFLPGTIDALVALATRGYECYIVTNQPGIARGMVKEVDVQDIHARMQEALRAHDIAIAGIYYCPHGWDEGCACRKPSPGMFYQAAREHQIDLSRAVFVGDDERDVEAGNRAGVPTILVSSLVGIAEALEKLP